MLAVVTIKSGQALGCGFCAGALPRPKITVDVADQLTVNRGSVEKDHGGSLCHSVLDLDLAVEVACAGPLEIAPPCRTSLGNVAAWLRPAPPRCDTDADGVFRDVVMARTVRTTDNLDSPAVLEEVEIQPSRIEILTPQLTVSADLPCGSVAVCPRAACGAEPAARLLKDRKLRDRADTAHR